MRTEVPGWTVETHRPVIKGALVLPHSGCHDRRIQPWCSQQLPEHAHGMGVLSPWIHRQTQHSKSLQSAEVTYLCNLSFNYSGNSSFNLSSLYSPEGVWISQPIVSSTGGSIPFLTEGTKFREGLSRANTFCTPKSEVAGLWSPISPKPHTGPIGCTVH